MKEVFQFWGYGPGAWASLVGSDKLLVPGKGEGTLETRFGCVRFADEVLDLVPEFADDLTNGMLAFVRLRPDSEPAEKPVAWLEEDGTPLLSRTDGSWRFHFDLDETIEFIQQELYFPTKPPIYVKMGISPENLPAAVRKGILLAFAGSRLAIRKLSNYRAFPKVYKDLSVDIWRFLGRRIVETAPDAPETEPLWPDGKEYAVVLNHDLDTEWGFSNDNGIKAFREIEEALGLRSAWLAVAQLRQVGRTVFRDLIEVGHEIGCHGTVHDHQIAYLPVGEVKQRLIRARPFLEEYGCLGFRSPSYHRSEALYQGLDGILTYDMSMHDCVENNNSPVPSFEGCSTCFPFRIVDTGVIEIPTTVAEDITLELAGQSPEQALVTQKELVEAIARRCGVANILTHPEPMLSARPPWIEVYRRLLQHITGDQRAWFVLPGQLCAWWKERDAAIRERWRDA